MPHGNSTDLTSLLPLSSIVRGDIFRMTLLHCGNLRARLQEIFLARQKYIVGKISLKHIMPQAYEVEEY